MSEVENLCLACGICCDGSLIGFVQVETDEFAALRGILPIEESEQNGFFLQPCTKFCKKCTIYADRPKQCALFECGLLKSVEIGQLDFTTAMEIVRLVIDKKRAIETQLIDLQLNLKSPSFCFKMMELKNLLHHKNEIEPLAQKFAELSGDMHALNDLVKQRFKVSYF